MKKAMISTALLLMVAAVYFFTTFLKGDQESTPSQTVKQISLFHYFSGSLSGGIAEMIDTVNSGSINRQVLAQPLDHEAFKSMIHSTLAKGNPPELFTYWAGAKTQDLVDQGQLQPIDDIWNSIPLTGRFSRPVTEAASTYNGHKYLLPITQHFVVFFYNKKVFEREGITTPATWQEFEALAAQLRNSGLVPIALGAKERWPAQFWFDYLLLRTAGPDYRQALMEGNAKYTDPEVHRTYSLWAGLLTQGYFNGNANDLDWDEATRLVCDEQAAMTLMGTWALQLFAGEHCGLEEESGFDFFAFPLVDTTIAKAAVGPVDGIVLTKNSVEQEFAKTIVSYFAEDMPQRILSEGSGAFAPSSNVPLEFYSPLRQRILQESETAAHWAFNYDLATPVAIAEKGMDSFSEIIAFPDQIEDVLRNLQKEVDTIRQH